MKTNTTKKRTREPRGGLRVKSILVPIDFSAASKKTLAHAVALARQFKAKVTVLHVVEPVATPSFVEAFPLVIEEERLVTAAKKELDRAVKVARIPAQILEKVLVRVGRSFHQIADTARTRKVDLIVISTHGYTGLKHAVLGSTTERVVRLAPCPVLVIRQR